MSALINKSLLIEKLRKHVVPFAGWLETISFRLCKAEEEEEEEEEEDLSYSMIL